MKEVENQKKMRKNPKKTGKLIKKHLGPTRISNFFFLMDSSFDGLSNERIKSATPGGVWWCIFHFKKSKKMSTFGAPPMFFFQIYRVIFFSR